MFSFFCAVFFVFVKCRVIVAPAAATDAIAVTVVVNVVGVSSSLVMVKPDCF